MKRKHVYSVMALAAMFMVIVGCSALQVDVDVYKGPLADEKEIQMERMAVMAIGAKPLIVELRDQLENKEREEICKKYGKALEQSSILSFCDERAEKVFGKHQDGYVEGYMDVYNGMKILNGTTLVGSKSRRINALLSLYQDRGSDIIDEYFNKIDYYSREYTREMQLLSSMYKKWADVEFSSETDKLALHIRHYLGYAKEYKTGDVVIFKPLKKFCVEESNDDILKKNSNSTEFEFLNNISQNKDKMADVLSGMVYTESTEALRKDMALRAKTFLNSRLALQRLVELQLGLIITINSQPARYPSETIEKVTRDTLSALRMVVDNKKVRLDENIQNKDIIKVAISCLEMHRELLVDKAQNDKLSERYGIVNVYSVSGTADENREIKIIDKDNGEIDYSSTQGLSLKIDSMLSIQSGMGFETGRLDHGLETLIENYVTSSSDSNSYSINPHKVVLCKALVRFAQKLLTIANNEVLLSQYSGSREIADNAQLLQAIGNSIMIQASEISREEKYKDALKDTKIELNSLRMVYGAMPGKDVLADLVSHMSNMLAQIESMVEKKTAETKAAETAKLEPENTAAKQQSNQYEISLRYINGIITARKNTKKYETIDDLVVLINERIKVASEKITPLEAQKDQLSESDKKQLKKWNDEKAALEFGLSQSIDFKTEKESPAGQEGLTADAFLKWLTAAQSTLDGKIKENQAKLAKAGESDSVHQSQITNLKQAIACVNGLIPSWSDGDGDIPSPSVTYATLRARIDGPTTSKNATISTAIKESNYIPPRILPDAMLQDGQYPDSKAVLDQLITVLSYRHIRATELGNKQMASNLKDAINKARDLRSRKAFLRPASSYLRYSYPATSLQGDDALGWKNHLRDHFFLTSPFRVRSSNSSAVRQERVMNELDKQSWQNINTIRLNGAGSTNYVLAKDPVGNWMVKAYTTNATAIANSALNLAKYSMGMPTGTIKGTDGAPMINAANQQTAMDRLQDGFRAVYDSGTAQQLEELKSAQSADTVKAAIKEKWAADADLQKAEMDSLTSALDSAAGELKDLNDKTSSGQIREAMDNLRKFYAALSAALSKAEVKLKAEKKGSTATGGTEANEQLGTDASAPEPEFCKTCPEIATTIAKGYIGDILDTHIEKRRSVIKKYEDAIVLIGEATNPATETTPADSK